MNKFLLLISLFSLNSFSQSGEIDTSFGDNGKVTTGFGTNSNMARCVAFQPDGKFIVGGSYLSSRGDNDFALARYNNDGTPDLTFGMAGKSVTNFLEINNTSNYMLSIRVLADGKILAMGSTAQSIGSNLAIVRYNENGSIDIGFGTNGKIVSALSPMALGGFGGSLAVQPDGKIVLTGVKLVNFDPTYYTGLERYNDDGSPDTTFGTAGQAYSSYGTGKSFPSSVTLQPDGKIVVGGTYMQTNAPIMAAMRFNANGTLDTSFSGDGKVTTTFGTGMYSDGMQISVENTKITLAGIMTSNTSRNFAMVRYLADGNLDTTFDTDGKALTPFDLEDDYSLVNSVSKQPNGKYVLVFKSDDYLATGSDFVARRYNGDTSLDTNFGSGGKIMTTFDTGLNEAQMAAISPDGKMYLVGKSIPLAYDHTEFATARYSANGILDTTLDGDGKVTTFFEKGNDRMNKLFVLPDDKILAVGISDYRNANNSTARDIILSKYNSDGSLDNSFGNSGKVLSVLGQQINTITASAIQPDGKITIGNMYYVFGQTSYSYEIVRYQANGNLDTAFGTNGKQALNFYPDSIIF